jgi:hypothetical protein
LKVDLGGGNVKLVRAVGWLTAALLIPACGPGGNGKGGPNASHSPEDGGDLSLPGLSVSGGNASGGSGGDAGSFTVRSNGAIQSSQDAAPSAPSVSTAPASGGFVGDLSQDLVLGSSATMSGTLTSGGNSPVRSITVNGDLTVSGTLAGADLGDRGQGFSLRASGTITIDGEVRTGGGDVALQASQIVIGGTVSTAAKPGTGLRGGAIHIDSRGAVVLGSGLLSSAGSDGATLGGDGGPMTIRGGDAVYLGGTIDARGGVAIGDANAVRGGSGASIAISSAVRVDVAAALRVHGGTAQTSGAGASGGDGGAVTVDGAVPVRLTGTLDARGGSVSASSGGHGGRGGRISIGSASQVSSLMFREGNFAADGGSGSDSGGRGGTQDLLSWSGGVVLTGTFSAQGGAAGGPSGPGGRISARADAGGGNLESGATLRASGGSATSTSSSAAGGDGGRIELFATYDSSHSSGGSGGSITLTSSSAIIADGGTSTGSAAAGKGGNVHLEIPEATISVSGRITARGGAALGSGSGGLGGFLWIDSDSNDNAIGGDLTLESGGILDASGGDSAGGTGGDARWSPLAGVFDPDRIPIAVLLDSDSVQGGPNHGGYIRNNGTVVARGGKPNGHGGDVEFHGFGNVPDPVTGEPNPARDDVRNEGDGSGGSGAFVSD